MYRLNLTVKHTFLRSKNGFNLRVTIRYWYVFFPPKNLIAYALNFRVLLKSVDIHPQPDRIPNFQNISVVLRDWKLNTKLCLGINISLRYEQE